jgi:hypothetical protein
MDGRVAVRGDDGLGLELVGGGDGGDSGDGGDVRGMLGCSGGSLELGATTVAEVATGCGIVSYDSAILPI